MNGTVCRSSFIVHKEVLKRVLDINGRKIQGKGWKLGECGNRKGI